MDQCRELASIELRRSNRSIHHARTASPDPAQDVQTDRLLKTILLDSILSA